MLRGGHVCDLSDKVQSVLSTQNAEGDVRPDPIDQKVTNSQTHVTAATQLQVM